MRKALAALMAPVILCGFTLVLSGCTEESGVKSDVKTTAPDGSSTNVHKEVTIDKKGDNPPVVAPIEKK
jgi:hypothetical protein